MVVPQAVAVSRDWRAIARAAVQAGHAIQFASK
jgi:hypothetical protein